MVVRKKKLLKIAIDFICNWPHFDWEKKLHLFFQMINWVQHLIGLPKQNFFKIFKKHLELTANILSQYPKTIFRRVLHTACSSLYETALLVYNTGLNGKFHGFGKNNKVITKIPIKTQKCIKLFFFPL